MTKPRHDPNIVIVANNLKCTLEFKLKKKKMWPEILKGGIKYS